MKNVIPDRMMKTTNQNLGVIGLGCMGFSHAYGKAVSDEQAIAAIQAAYVNGCRFFDTAAVYTGETEEGKLSINEKLVGQALKEVRDQVVIATKYGVMHGEEGLITDGSVKNLRASLEQSLKNLQTDYIDLFYLHRVDPKVPLEEIAEEMKRQIAAGRIRGWGLSEANEEQIRKAHAICPLSAVQNRFSLMADWHRSLFPVCDELGIVFVAFSPLANGALSAQYEHTSFTGKEDFRSTMPQFTEEGKEKSSEILHQLEKMARQKGCTPAQLSLAWMTTLNPNLIPIPGSTKSFRIEENLKAAKIALSAKDLEQLNALARQARSIPVYGGAKIEK